MSPPRITAQAAVLLVRDLRKSLDWWTQTLGFGEPSLWGDPPEFAIIGRDGARIMLGQAKDGCSIDANHAGRAGLCDAYFWVDDARTLAGNMAERGAIMEYDVALQDYGVLEFGVRDPEGRVISFGEIVGNKQGRPGALDCPP